MELNLTIPLKHVTQLIVWENECIQLKLTFLVLLGRTSRKDNVFRQQKTDCIPQLKYRYFGLFSSDYAPTIDSDAFAKMNSQPSNMQGEHWIMVANSGHKLYFLYSLGCKKLSFFKLQSKQMMLGSVQSQPSVSGFNTIFAAFIFFELQRKITGVHDVNIFSIIDDYI